jgi:hypothetical protein
MINICPRNTRKARKNGGEFKVMPKVKVLKSNGNTFDSPPEKFFKIALTRFARRKARMYLWLFFLCALCAFA